MIPAPASSPSTAKSPTNLTETMQDLNVSLIFVSDFFSIMMSISADSGGQPGQFILRSQFGIHD